MEKEIIKSFKCIIYPGNNPQIFKHNLEKRKVWKFITFERWKEANFIWKPLNFSPIIYSSFEEILKGDPSKKILLNHFEDNKLITTKSGLVKSLTHYYSHEIEIVNQNYNVFETIPTTFIIKVESNSKELKNFMSRFSQLNEHNYTKQKMPEKHCQRNIWFVKPESQNQGRGIKVSDNINEIKSFLSNKPLNSSWIIQKAVERPLLYHKRKFDIRIWVLVTQNFDIYYYNLPYLRTSSSEYTLNNFQSSIHLTNNFQQKHLDQYSKYEQGNTLPFQNLKNYLIEFTQFKQKANEIIAEVISRVKFLILDCFYSVKKSFINLQKKKQFQLFGFDFLIDEDFRVWLLEVNNNPYLGVPNKYIGEILPRMVDEMLTLTIDKYFPPHPSYEKPKESHFLQLHKQSVMARISQRNGSIDLKKKDYYPMVSMRNESSTSHRIRRYSESINLIDNQKIKIKILTSIQSIKNLLDNYLFSDFDPFIIPVNAILNSQKLRDLNHLISNKQALKIIIKSRIVSIFMQSKTFVSLNNCLKDTQVSIDLKTILIQGLCSFLKELNHKNMIINSTMPILLEIIRQNHNKQLIEAILELMMKLGGEVKRNIFVPGQTRQDQTARYNFIISKCFTLFLYLVHQHSQILSEQVKVFLNNFSQKDMEFQKRINPNKQFSLEQIKLDIEGLEERRQFSRISTYSSNLAHRNLIVVGMNEPKRSLRSFREKNRMAILEQQYQINLKNRI